MQLSLYAVTGFALTAVVQGCMPSLHLFTVIFYNITVNQHILAFIVNRI